MVGVTRSGGAGVVRGGATPPYTRPTPPREVGETSERYRIDWMTFLAVASYLSMMLPARTFVRITAPPRTRRAEPASSFTGLADGRISVLFMA